MTTVRDFLAQCRKSPSNRELAERVIGELKICERSKWQGIFESALGGQDEPEDHVATLEMISDLIYDHDVPVETLLIIAQGA